MPEEPLDVLDENRQFAEQQQSGIGATDTPKILGLSRYGTALSVYRKKVDTLPEPGEDPPKSSLPAWMGLHLQGTVSELYHQATGYRVRAAKGHYRHKKYPWMVCHLDYRVWGQPFILVECKTRAYMKGWGEDGTAAVPPDVWAQVQHEMAVMNAQETHVAVLFGHHSFRVYRVPRDQEFLDRLVPKLQEFWQRVLDHNPPPPTGHYMDSDILNEQYPLNRPMYRNATATQEQAVGKMRGAMADAEAARLAADEAKNRVKDIIGTSLGLIGPFGKVTWLKPKDSIVVDHEIIAGVYLNAINELLPMAQPRDDLEARRLRALEEALPQVPGLYTRIKDNPRRLSVAWADEEH